MEAVSNLFKSASAVAQDTIGSNDAIVAEIEDVKTGITAFQAFFQETAEDLIDIEAIANEVTELIDRFVDLVSDTLRTEVGPCRLLSAAYDDLTSSACEDGQESLDAYWFAIAIMTLAGFVLIIASFKVSELVGAGRWCSRPVCFITSQPCTYYYSCRGISCTLSSPLKCTPKKSRRTRR